MLYKTVDAFLVVDMFRPQLPVNANDILVPLYIEKQDFVCIHGEDEPYYGKVCSSDSKKHACKVRFFERSNVENNAFKQIS